MSYQAESVAIETEAMEALGLTHIAYIKRAGENGYAVCSADGKQLAIFPNYDTAFFTARQYNLFPVNVH